MQRVVGHKSATLTLDTYSELRPDRLEEVADALGPVAPARARRLRAVE